ncbi:hypothetical protein LTR78_002426 [Recurvomyces mirabilis]|uniref:RNase H type-1 domain-containing protein n=1 Tax=Recurvomyces mirabilis TaxID=574656 RepID=A0AAE0WTN5_9PEZI|nr:hypothetical protein LTR78_002426 [Recurvomyces mirabilis]KAK5157355.1 hypothetical protein LTS14_004120 [Recurvomyces mirabilis]
MSSIGVFVGCGSQYNVSELMARREHFPSSVRAELAAAIKALRVVMRMRDDRVLPGPTKVVLKMDCQDIQLTMISRIFEWKTTSYKRCRSMVPLLDRDLYFDLEEAVCTLWNQYAVAVLFWWVPREHNRDADDLATAAMNREDLRIATAHATLKRMRDQKRRRDDEDEGQSARLKRPRILPATPVLPRPANLGSSIAHSTRSKSNAIKQSNNVVIDLTGDSDVTSGLLVPTKGTGDQTQHHSPLRHIAPPPSRPMITGVDPKHPKRSANHTLPRPISKSTDTPGMAFTDAQGSIPLWLKPRLLPKDWSIGKLEAVTDSQSSRQSPLPVTSLAPTMRTSSTDSGNTMSSFCLARHGSPLTLSPVPDITTVKSVIKRIIPAWAQSRTAKALSRFQGLGRAAGPAKAQELKPTKLATAFSEFVVSEGAPPTR